MEQASFQCTQCKRGLSISFDEQASLTGSTGTGVARLDESFLVLAGGPEAGGELATAGEVLGRLGAKAGIVSAKQR